MKTLSELQTAVIANTQRSDKLSVITDGLNFGIDELTRRHVFRALRTEVSVEVVADDSQFPIPEGMTHVSNIRVLNGETLVHTLCVKSKNTLMREFPSLGRELSTGTPAHGYEEAGIIHFFPTASQTFTMLVTGDGQGGHMESETDTPGIEGIDEALIAYATAHVFRSIQLYEDSGFWEGTFERRAITAIRNDKRQAAEIRQLEPFPGPSGVPDVDPTKDPFYGQG